MEIKCPYHKKSERLWMTCGAPEMDYVIITQFKNTAMRKAEEIMFCQGSEKARGYCEIFRSIEAAKKRAAAAKSAAGSAKGSPAEPQR